MNNHAWEPVPKQSISVPPFGSFEVQAAEPVATIEEYSNRYYVGGPHARKDNSGHSPHDAMTFARLESVPLLPVAMLFEVATNKQGELVTRPLVARSDYEIAKLNDKQIAVRFIKHERPAGFRRNRK